MPQNQLMLTQTNLYIFLIHYNFLNIDEANVGYHIPLFKNVTIFPVYRMKLPVCILSQPLDLLLGVIYLLVTNSN